MDSKNCWQVTSGTGIAPCRYLGGVSLTSLILFAVIGALLGAVPATVMEIVQPAPWSPAVLTAFGMPIAAGAATGALAWLVVELKRSAR